ncbi:rhodanese-like domain-containing protein [Magnetococcales bacterium HHB-1]
MIRTRLKHMIGLLAVMALWLWSPLALAGEEGGSGGVPLGDAVASAQQAYAKGVNIAPFTLNGVEMVQNRGQVPDAFKDPASRKCKPFCVQPDTLPGITTVKVEDFAGLAEQINSGAILIVDMRTSKWFKKGTLPGATSLPYSALTGKKTKAKVKMKKLKGKGVIGFCNGWWCGQSPTGLKALQELGYGGQLYYFRGGIQDWVDAGLSLTN